MKNTCIVPTKDMSVKIMILMNKTDILKTNKNKYVLFVFFSYNWPQHLKLLANKNPSVTKKLDL